jgi:putative addiction module component (TIGR02574 family)
MSKIAKQVLDSALTLPAIERAALVESLLSSLDRPDPTIDVRLVEEAEDRIAAFDSGRMEAIDIDEVFAEWEKP